jgi:hypothetical protein
MDETWSLVVVKYADSSGKSAGSKNKQKDYVCVCVLETVPPRMDAFAQREEEQILKQGIRTRLLCGVSQGDKPMDFSWTKDAQPLSALFGSRGGGPGVVLPAVNVREVDADSSALTFTNLSAVHSGRYECAARNAAGVARQSTLLFVQGILPPSPTSSQPPQNSWTTKSYIKKYFLKTKNGALITTRIF